MRATRTNLKTLLEGVRQYVAPAYQRRYIWIKPQWESLWRAVGRQHVAIRAVREAEAAGLGALQPATHFLGSFVLAPQLEPAAALARHHVIDGQQRLTTVAVLLAVLRDVVDERSEGAGEQIHHTYLVNQYKEGDEKPKIMLTEADRSDLLATLVSFPAAPTGLIGSAYTYFRNQLDVQFAQEPDYDLEVLETAIVTRLSVVDITAEGGDNVHRIFQTLNSLGVRLDQVDLLRNHFFMLLPNAGDDVFKEVWRPLETTLGLSGLDNFFFVDLVRRRSDRKFARHDVYPVYQEELEPNEHDESAVVEMLRDIKRRAEIYRQILEPDLQPDDEVALRLRRLAEWGTTTVHPLVMEILLRLADGRCSASDAADALLYVESYLVRRLLLKIPTNNLNRIISEIPAALPADGAIAEDVRAALSAPARYWPTDDDVHARITSEDFYLAQRPPQRQFILRRLEEALPHEVPPDWSSADLTLEHVMPQSITVDWFSDLGAIEEEKPTDQREAPLEVHARLVHTIGNITLTAYNPELGTKPFEEKKQLIFDRGPLELNKAILSEARWGGAEIEARSRRLGEMAIELWPGPTEGAGGAGAVDSWALVDAALTALPAGSWTTYAQLSELSNIPASEIRSRLHASSRPGASRVMLPDGRIDVQAPWAQENLAAYRQQLVADGIIPSATDVEARPSAYVPASELADLIGEA